MIGRLLAAPELRAKLSRGAVDRAGEFSWDRTATGLLAVSREAMVEHRARQAAAVG